jgi:hypothetical protein
VRKAQSETKMRAIYLAWVGTGLDSIWVYACVPLYEAWTCFIVINERFCASPRFLGLQKIGWFVPSTHDP